MRKCDHCGVEIKGNWNFCPLCSRPLNRELEPVPSSYPDVPLKFHYQTITKWMVLLSIVIILITFALGWIWQGEIHWIQAAVFGVMTMWLVVLTILRKRRNIAKSMLYILVILSLLSVYLDYLIGWTSWATTFAIPIICSATLIGMFLAARLARMKTADYILYLTSVAILGLVPLAFIIFNWVTTVVPALISIGLSALLLFIIIIAKGNEIKYELQKRTFI